MKTPKPAKVLAELAAVLLFLVFGFPPVSSTAYGGEPQPGSDPLAAPALPGEVADSPWPTFRHDLRNTGYTPYTGPATPDVAWIFSASGEILASPTLGRDGTIYIGTRGRFSGGNQGDFYALRPDGTVRWTYPVTSGFFASAALGPGNIIYVVSLDGNLHALADHGTHAEVQWVTQLDVAYSSPAVASDGTIYVGGLAFAFYAIDPTDGSIKWDWTTGWCIFSSAAISDDGIVYVGSKDQQLYALDPALEAAVWQFAAGDFYDGHMVDSSPAVGADGTIYFGTDPYGSCCHTPVAVDTSFWAVNPDGSLKWSFDTGDGVESSPAIGPDGTVYFGSYDHHLYAVADTGSAGVLQWKFPTGGTVDGSPTVDRDGVVYFGSRDSNIYALHADGTVKWSFPTSGDIESSPTIDHNGYLYIGGFDGNLYVLGTGAPDVGVVSIDLPDEVVAGAAYSPRATVGNFRAADQQVDVACSITTDGMAVYSDTTTLILSGGSDEQYTFAPWAVELELGTAYIVAVTTSLAEDENVGNNSRVVQTLSYGGQCGDGIVSVGEECDDGNRVPGDGCDADCLIEVEGIPTVSGWHVIILALLLAAAGKTRLGLNRRRRAA